MRFLFHLALCAAAIVLSCHKTLMAQNCSGVRFYNANSLSPINNGKLLAFARIQALPYFTSTVNLFAPYIPSLPSSVGSELLEGCFAANPPYVSPPISYQSGAGSQRAAVIRAADYSSIGLAYLPFEPSNVLQVFRLNQDLSVTGPQKFSFGAALSSVLASDVNGDGKPDLIIPDGGSGSTGALWILLNNGDTTYKSPVQYNLPASANSVALADFNGDGQTRPRRHDDRLRAKLDRKRADPAG